MGISEGMMNKITTYVALIILMMGMAGGVAVQVQPKVMMSCGKVTSTLAPCFEYVLGGGKVPTNCCVGVKSLYKEASTTADRRNVCFCLKSVTSTASPAVLKNAKALPGKCGLSIPYQITPAIDCTKIK